LTPINVLAQEEVACESDVVVQGDDWLSKLADKFYGDPQAFPAIADATNAKAATDDSYTTIANVDMIEIGWKLCIPSAASEAASPEASVVSEAITIVQKFYEAFNQKKIGEAMTYIADDAVIPTLYGLATGKEEIQKAYEQYFKDGITVEMSEYKDKDGRVTAAYRVFENGIEVHSATDGVTIVKNGKIVFDGNETEEAQWLYNGPGILN
jgi:CO dehydrogenase/acetyl-CoA synthase gamma subunit (corrinoid Fe-S protein)